MSMDNIAVIAFCAGFLVSVILYFVAFLRIFRSLGKFSSIIDTVRDDNIKTRFIATSAKDSVAMVNTTIEDLQSQIDILRNSQVSTKTEEN